MTSPAGNRTPVSRVTGGDTDHVTNEDTSRYDKNNYLMIVRVLKYLFLFFFSKFLIICVLNNDCLFDTFLLPLKWLTKRKFSAFKSYEDQKTWKVPQNCTSPAGNRTLVSRVTGGDTHHYTIEDILRQWFNQSNGSHLR